MKLSNCIKVLMGATFMLGFAQMAEAKTKLTVYTAIEPEELHGFKQAFEKENSDIDLQWVRDSTGIITAKLLAEKDNTKADIVWGVAATSLLMLKDIDMLEAYSPAGVDSLNKKFLDKDATPSWVGQRAWVASLCYNIYEAKKHNLPQPTSWADLLDPVYKGHLVMPNPASSGTGFLDVSSWMQIMGEDKAWEFMDGLHENIGVYTHSGSKPCKMAAKGEFPIGISFAYKGAQLKSKGAPIEVIAPKEGLGWDVEAFGIIKSSQNKDAAKRFADWSVTKDANVIYNKGYAVVALDGVAQPVKNYPEEAMGLMIDNDFLWAAANRTRILKEWETRYGTKSEAK